MHGFTQVMGAVGQALWMSFTMFWAMLWGLVLGFAISGMVEAVVSKAQMSRLLPDDSPKSIVKATAIGAASSSCSYAAVAMTRSIFRKGANFTAAMAFQFASTNLVIELGIVLIVLLGWPFALGEFVGGAIMIVLLGLMFRMVMTRGRIEAARQQADKNIAGHMEGHAEMEMGEKDGTLWQRLFSAKGYTATSHFFIMNWAMLWKDIAVGLLISGMLGAWVPKAWWQAFFLSGHPGWSALWGAVVGPFVAVASFVCSIGNVPLAAVLWNGGISFGGVMAFIFGDLIVLPILNIYRKYYGWRMALRLGACFYIAMVLAALAVEGLFHLLGLVPESGHAQVGTSGISWNYTTVLNLIALAIAAALLWRFFRTGGPKMMRMMAEDDASPPETAPPSPGFRDATTSPATTASDASSANP